MPTIHELASEMHKAFEQVVRTDETTYYRLRDGSPGWMRDVCIEAHGDMGPDDERYEMIRDVVSAIDDQDEDADQSEARDNIEAPIYTHELTGWLASRTDRYAYCDEAMEEFGCDFKDTITLLRMGYMRELDEVFGIVLQELTKLADDDSEDSEGDEGDHLPG